MPSINKLLDKINQASSAVKSIKGIKSKIESIGYKGGVNTEEVDKLQAQAEEGRRKLEERRDKQAVTYYQVVQLLLHYLYPKVDGNKNLKYNLKQKVSVHLQEV